MFKFKDTATSHVWVRPEAITSVEHADDETEHVIIISTGMTQFYVYPDSEEKCRQFMFDLFKAMGQEYKYE